MLGVPTPPAVVGALGGKPTPTVTPTPLAYHVIGYEENLTPEVMRKWFKQSIIPLVGQDAADILDGFLSHEHPARPEEFLAKAIEFRKRAF